MTTSTDDLRIELVLHAVLRELAGNQVITLRLPAGATAAAALAALVERHPALAPHAGTVAFARADAIIRPDATLQDGDRVEVLPPVLGG